MRAAYLLEASAGSVDLAANLYWHRGECHYFQKRQVHCLEANHEQKILHDVHATFSIFCP